MEQEHAVAPQPAPQVQPQPAAAAPVAVAVPAVARQAAGPGLSPGVVRAIAPHAGNAAISRMLAGRSAVAREPAPTAAPPAPAGGAPVPAGAPPALKLPGGVPLLMPAGPGKVASTGGDKTIKAIDKKFGVSVPVGPLQGEIGGTLVGLARYKGGLSVHWDRPAAAVTDPASVKDTISVKNGRIAATGSVAGGIFGSIGLGNRLIAGTRVTAAGMVQASATGALEADGTLTRDGANGQWTGELDWKMSAQGSLTAAAAGYFEWNLLWLEGRREIFRLESFPLATITVRLGGKLKPDGSVTCPTRDFELELGTPPPARQVGGAPAAGGQPAKVAPKRRSADAPPDEPRPGTNVLARLPEDAPPAAAPAAAPGADVAAAPAVDPAAAPAVDPAAAPAGAQAPRSAEEIAAGSTTGDVVSPIVKSPDPEGAEP